MFDLMDLQLALRAKVLAGYAAADSGSADLGVAGGKYVRGTGSFVTDGFRPGMELLASGFNEAANDGLAIVVGVTALALQADRTLAAEDVTVPFSRLDWGDPGLWTGYGTGLKGLVVGLPSRRAWEATELAPPEPGAPWVEEQLVPGPTSRLTIGRGAGGLAELVPMYALGFHVPEGWDVAALRGYMEALAGLLPHGAVVMVNGRPARVRSDTGPYFSQALRQHAGWVSGVVTVPLRLHTFTTA